MNPKYSPENPDSITIGSRKSRLKESISFPYKTTKNTIEISLSMVVKVLLKTFSAKKTCRFDPVFKIWPQQLFFSDAKVAVTVVVLS